jgi:uncharacterized protein YlxW (UPF0749 family)
MPEAAEPAADPAAEPASEPGSERDRGRSRLWRALLRPSRGQLVVAVLLAVVGFAAVTQVRTNQVDDTYAGLREQDLIDILDRLADQGQRAQAELQRLEETRDDLQSETNAREAALEAARNEAETLAIIAGTVPVTGPGIRITIKEVNGQVRVEPFLDMVQALRSAGAEAIQVNGDVRVVASTSFQDVEGGILVDGQVLSAPFTVDVIGGPEALGAALRFPNGPQEQFAEDDAAELTWDDLTALDIEAVHEPVPPVVAEAD